MSSRMQLVVFGMLAVIFAQGMYIMRSINEDQNDRISEYVTETKFDVEQLTRDMEKVKHKLKIKE